MNTFDDEANKVEILKRKTKDDKKAVRVCSMYANQTRKCLAQRILLEANPAKNLYYLVITPFPLLTISLVNSI